MLTKLIWVKLKLMWHRKSDARDVGSEEVNAVAVEVASGAFVVLSGSRIGVPSENLGVAERHAGVEGVGDGGVP